MNLILIVTYDFSSCKNLNPDYASLKSPPKKKNKFKFSPFFALRHMKFGLLEGNMNKRTDIMSATAASVT